MQASPLLKIVAFCLIIVVGLFYYFNIYAPKQNGVQEKIPFFALQDMQLFFGDKISPFSRGKIPEVITQAQLSELQSSNNSAEAISQNSSSSSYGTQSNGTSSPTTPNTQSVVTAIPSLVTSSVVVTPAPIVGEPPAILPLPPIPGDITAPSVPTNLIVGNITTSSVEFSWNASTDANGIARYHIQRDGTSVPIAASTDTTHTDTGLNANTTYSYRVSAQDASGNMSTYSSALLTTTENVATAYDIVITTSGSGSSINSGVFGLSMARAVKFKAVGLGIYVNESNSAEAMYANVNLSTLRFPGGTVAMAYDPFNDYGELVRFIDFAQDTNVNDVIYVSNLYSGTIDQTLYTMNEIRNAGLTIVGVELGNEIHLNAYRDLIPTVADYVSVAEAFRSAIETGNGTYSGFPGMKFGVPVGPSYKDSHAFLESWNASLSSAMSAGQLDVDAVIPHYYRQTQYCHSSNIASAFECAVNDMKSNGWSGEQSMEFYMKYMPDYYEDVFDVNEMWVTEWAVKDAHDLYGNTLWDGQHAFKQLLEFWRGNADSSIDVTHAHFQIGFSSLTNGWIMTEGAETPLEASDGFQKSTAYYAFDFADDFASGGKILNTQITGVSPDDIHIESFRKGSTTYVSWVNLTDKDYTTNVQGNSRYLRGDEPWSSNGRTDFSNSIYSPIFYESLSQTNVIPAWSFGYIATSQELAQNSNTNSFLATALRDTGEASVFSKEGDSERNYTLTDILVILSISILCLYLYLRLFKSTSE